MRGRIEADYLVVGAGTAGMVFTDRILAHSDATVAIVDRRHAPGGHWQDAYPFVRLHQPANLYGVESVPFGASRRDVSGTNAGMYELAGPERDLCAFRRGDDAGLPAERPCNVPARVRVR
ncbi:hypothetical protein StoSoilB13_07970 [Arthrobacter sp. StoSoilB13]|nr:hypothetical protein StoSoilB13_07970 [Arthrobacter sp. StoSoilB13]